LREHTVRYNLNRLIERDTIHLVPLVDLGQVGYLRYQLFFSLINNSSKERLNQLKKIWKLPAVTSLFEYGGAYDYGVLFYVQSMNDLSTCLEQFSDQLGPFFAEKRLVLRTSSTTYNRRYLYPWTTRTRQILQSMTTTPTSIDDTDHRILNTLLNTSFSSCCRLAAHLGLPASTTKFRLQKLERMGVITGWTYALNKSQLNIHTYRMLVTVKDFTPVLEQKLRQFVHRRSMSLN